MNLPEIFIPFVICGKATQLAITSYTSVAASSSVTINLRPSRQGMVRVSYAGYVAPTRVVATGDIIFTANAGTTYTQWSPDPLAELPVLTEHTRLFIGSYIEKPVITPIYYRNPQKLVRYNDETFAIQQDMIFWHIEMSEPTYINEFIPYMKGMVKFYQELGKKS